MYRDSGFRALKLQSLLEKVFIGLRFFVFWGLGGGAIGFWGLG